MSGFSGARIVLVGAFDLAQRARLVDVFESVGDDPIVALDLERTTYIDSITLGCIIRLNADLDERSARLFVTGVSPSVKRILDVTGLSSILPGSTELDELLKGRGTDVSGLRLLELASDAEA